jgi:8-amino-7-oxononanoate synthase
LSKAYSSLLAFIACPSQLKGLLKVAAPPYLYSGPSPIASLATALSGLEVNEVRGDTIRADLHRKVAVVLEALDELEISTPNTSGLPIIEIPLADHRDVDEVGQFLFDRGIYTTIAAYPLVPRTEVGFRVQVTSANDDDQIARLVAVLDELSTKFRLQTAQTMAQWWDGNRASALRA